MITILPADEAVVHLYATAENSALDRGMILRDRETELGHMLYAVEGERAVLGRLVCEERLLRDGLLRAVLHAARNAGCRTAVSCAEEDKAFLSGYGFREKEGVLSVSIAGFFSGGCKGCNGDCANCGK